MDDLEVETLDLRSPWRRQSPKPSADVAQLQKRLVEEMQARRAAEAKILTGPAAARITGRLARIDSVDEKGVEVLVWLIVQDQREDGAQDQRSLFQAVKIRAQVNDLSMVTDGCQLTVVCKFHRGQLALDFIDEILDCSDPLPENVRIPARRVEASSKTDGQLPTIEEADRAAREGGWGSLNHSVFRCPIAWHLTTSPKCRAKSFEGHAIEAQIIMRQVAEAEGLTVIAIAAESDHVHLLGIPAGAGGMPPTWQWSRWIGRWKALCSKRLKSIPGLEEFEWQTGYALTSVNGGKQGAEQALAIVEQYVRAQGANESQGDGSRDE